MMYIAIENMGSAYGYKSKNTFCKSNSVKNKAKAKEKAKAKAKVYEQRQALAKRLGFDPKNDPADLNDMLSCPRIWSELNKSSPAHPSSAFAGFAVKKSKSSVTKPVKYSMSNRPNTLSR
jgi:hypothetical protein